MVINWPLRSQFTRQLRGFPAQNGSAVLAGIRQLVVYSSYTLQVLGYFGEFMVRSPVVAGAFRFTFCRFAPLWWLVLSALHFADFCKPLIQSRSMKTD
jgi:hypothetical protein